MPINIVDNFRINTELPIDSRIIATNSLHRDSIEYKYDGMKVTQLDSRVTYVWNKSKFLLTGVTSTSWDTNNNSITGQGTPNYLSKWDSTGLGLTDSSIVSMPTQFNEVSQKVGLGGVPYEAFQVNGNYSVATLGTSSMPFVIHKGVNTIIGENWYWDISLSQDKAFDINFGSSTIAFKNGGFEFKGRTAGDGFVMKTRMTINNDASVYFGNYFSINGTSSIPNAPDGSIYYDTSLGNNKIRVKEDNQWKRITKGYNVYTAELSQSGISAPSQVILETSIGSGVWSYGSTGIYNLYVPGGFSGSTPMINGFCGTFSSTSVFFGDKVDSDNYRIRTLYSIGGTHSNDLLLNRTIEIKIY